MTTIAERRILTDVPLLKAVFAIMARDWEALVAPRKPHGEASSYLTHLVEHLNVNEKTMRVLIAVAMGDARTRDNVI